MLMEEPKMEIIEFEDDVITKSGDGGGTPSTPSGESCEGPDAPMNTCSDFMD